MKEITIYVEKPALVAGKHLAKGAKITVPMDEGARLLSTGRFSENPPSRPPAKNTDRPEKTQKTEE